MLIYFFVGMIHLSRTGMYASVLDIIREIPEMSAILVVDLSSPQFLWHTIDSALKVVMEFLSKRGDVQQMQAERKSALPDDYPVIKRTLFFIACYVYVFIALEEYEKD